jgi:hypothetical protein
MPRPVKPPPGVEALDDRLLPTSTRLVIDFTPDPGTRPLAATFTPRPFANAFRTTDPRGFAPRFLDFNGDGFVDGDDVRLAAAAVVRRVTDYFRPFLAQRVSVLGVDLEQNTGAGLRQIRKGVASGPLQVFVIYLGGGEADPTVFGRAPQAARGFNHEGFGRVYSDTFVRWQSQTNPNASPADFAASIASTVAHELGHLLGLGHPANLALNRDSLMNSARVRGVGDSFVDRFYLAEVFPRPTSRTGVFVSQNPFLELLRSFRGQPDESGGSVRPPRPHFPQVSSEPSLSPPPIPVAPDVLDAVFAGWADGPLSHA